MLQSQYWIGREWHYWHITRSACTRSDVTADFVDKGKVKPFDIVLKSNMFCTFSKLGDQIDIQQSHYFGFCIWQTTHGRCEWSQVCFLSTAPCPKETGWHTWKNQRVQCLHAREFGLTKLFVVTIVAYVWRHAILQNPNSILPQGHGWIVMNI